MDSEIVENSSDWTTDQLTRAHIKRLQQAWQDSSVEAQLGRDQVALLSLEVQRLREELVRFRRRDRTKEVELILSENFALAPEEPQSLLRQLSRYLPQYESGHWIVAAAARAGDAWICVTTESGRQEELVFTSHTFDNFLRFRQNNVQRSSVLETLSEVLPVDVVHFVLTGEQPTQALESTVLRQDSADTGMTPYYYHRQTRVATRGLVLSDVADKRCVLMLSFVCTDRSLRQQPIAVVEEEAAAHEALAQMLVPGIEHGDLDWQAVLHQTAQLFLAAVVKKLEFREAEQHRFRGSLLTVLEQSLHSTTQSVGTSSQQAQGVVAAVQRLLQREVAHALDESHRQAADHQVDDERWTETEYDLDASNNDEKTDVDGNGSGKWRWTAHCELVFAASYTDSSENIFSADTGEPELALALQAGLEPARRLLWLNRGTGGREAVFESDQDAMLAAVAAALRSGRPALRSFARLSPLLPQSHSGTTSTGMVRDVEARMRRDQVNFLVLPIAPDEGNFDGMDDVTTGAGLSPSGGLRMLWMLRLSATSFTGSSSETDNSSGLLRVAAVPASLLHRTCSALVHRDAARTLWSWLRRSHFAPLSIFRPIDDSSSNHFADNICNGEVELIKNKATVDEVVVAERLLRFLSNNNHSQAQQLSKREAGEVTQFIRETLDSDLAIVLHLSTGHTSSHNPQMLHWLSDAGATCSQAWSALSPGLRTHLISLISSQTVVSQAAAQTKKPSQQWFLQSSVGSGINHQQQVWLRSQCLTGDRKGLLTLLALEKESKEEEGHSEGTQTVVAQLDQLFDHPHLADKNLDLRAFCLSLRQSTSSGDDQHAYGQDDIDEDDHAVLCILHGRLLRRLPGSTASHQTYLQRLYSPLLRVSDRLLGLRAALQQSRRLSLQQRAIAALERSRERTESFRRGLHSLARSLRASSAGSDMLVRDVRRVLCEVITRYLKEELSDAIALDAKDANHSSSTKCQAYLRLSLHRQSKSNVNNGESPWLLSFPEFEWTIINNSNHHSSHSFFADIFSEEAPQGLGHVFPRLVLTVETRLSAAEGRAVSQAWQRFQSSLSFSVWRDELERFASQHRQVLLLYRASYPAVPCATPLSASHVSSVTSSSSHQHASGEEEENMFFNLSLAALHSAMLSKAKGRGGQSQPQLARPYHLHDYLHDAQLLRRLGSATCCEPFLLLPVTRQASLRRFDLQDEAGFDDEDEDEDEVFNDDEVPAYVHLLKLEPRMLRQRGLQVLAEQQLPLPRRLNRAVATAIVEPLQNAPSALRLHASDTSVLSVLPDASKTMIQYLSDLDSQLGRALLPMLLGRQAAERYQHLQEQSSSENTNKINGSEDVDADERRGFAEHMFSPEHSTVLLYSPRYPSTAQRRRSNSSSQGQQQAWAQPWATHYLLVVRSDRVSSLTSVLQLQRVLDAVYRPSLTIATGQSWFECVSGMERLLLASTSVASLLKRQQQQNTGQRQQLQLFNLEEAQQTHNTQLHAQQSQAERHKQMVKRLISRRSFLHLETAETADESRVTNFGFVSEQFFAEANNILAECVSITKAALGSDRYLASAGYLLAPQDLQKFVLSQQNSGSGHHHHSSARRNGLLRSFCDIPDATQRWEVGPRKFPCPATATDIQQLFRRRKTHTSQKTQTSLRHFFYDAASSPSSMSSPVHHSNYNKSVASALHVLEPQLHCVELTSAQMQRFLHHGDSTKSGAGSSDDTNSSGSASSGAGMAGFMLRTDITIWLLLLTAHVPVVRLSSSSTSEPAMKVERSEDVVVAAMLLYLRTDNEASAASTDAVELNEEISDGLDEDEEDEEDSSEEDDYYEDGDEDGDNGTVNADDGSDEEAHFFDESRDLFGSSLANNQNKNSTLNRTASFTRKPFSPSPTPAPVSSAPEQPMNKTMTRRPSVMLRMSGQTHAAPQPGLSRRVSFSTDIAASLSAAAHKATSSSNSDSSGGRGRNVSHSPSRKQHSSGSRDRGHSQSHSRSRSPNHNPVSATSSSSSSKVERCLGRSLLHGLLRVLDVSAALLSSLFLRRVAELVHETQIERRVAAVVDERDSLFTRLRTLHESLLRYNSSSPSSSSSSSSASSGSAAAQLLGRSSNNSNTSTTTTSHSNTMVSGSSILDKERRLTLASELAASLQRLLDDHRALIRRAETAEEQGRDTALRLRHSLASQTDSDRLLQTVVRSLWTLVCLLPHQTQHARHGLGSLLSSSTHILSRDPASIASATSNSNEQLMMTSASLPSQLTQTQLLQTLSAIVLTLATQTVSLRIAQHLLASADALGGLHSVLVDRLRPFALHMQTLALNLPSTDSNNNTAAILDSNSSVNVLAQAASYETYVSQLMRVSQLHLQAVDQEPIAFQRCESALSSDLSHLLGSDPSDVGVNEEVQNSVRVIELAVHWLDMSALQRDLRHDRRTRSKKYSKNSSNEEEDEEEPEVDYTMNDDEDGDFYYEEEKASQEEGEESQDIGCITGDARVFPGPLRLFRQQARRALISRQVAHIDGALLYRLASISQKQALRRAQQINYNNSSKKNNSSKSSREVDEEVDEEVLGDGGNALLEALAQRNLYVADVFLVPVLPTDSTTGNNDHSKDGMAAVVQRVFLQSRLPTASSVGNIARSASRGRGRSRGDSSSDAQGGGEEVRYDVSQDSALQTLLLSVHPLLEVLQSQYRQTVAATDDQQQETDGVLQLTRHSHMARLWRSMTMMLPIETTAASLSSSAAATATATAAKTTTSTGSASSKPRHRSSLLALPGRSLESASLALQQQQQKQQKQNLSNNNSKKQPNTTSTTAASTTSSSSVFFDLFQQLGVHLSDNFCLQVSLSASTLLRGQAAFFPLSDYHTPSSSANSHTTDSSNSTNSNNSHHWTQEVLRGLTAFAASQGEPLLQCAATSHSTLRLRRCLMRLAGQQQTDGRDFAVCTSTASVFGTNNTAIMGILGSANVGYGSGSKRGISPLHLLVSLIPLQDHSNTSSNGITNSNTADNSSSSSSRRPRFCVFVVEIQRSVAMVDALAMSFLVHLVNNHLHVHAAEAAQSRKETELKSLAGSLADTSRQMLQQTQWASSLSVLWRRLTALQTPAFSFSTATTIKSAHNSQNRNVKLMMSQVSRQARERFAELQQWLTDGRDLSAALTSSLTASLLSLSETDIAAYNTSNTINSMDYEASVATHGGEGVVSQWQRHSHSYNCVARASQHLLDSQQRGGQGGAAVVRRDVFCGALALRLRRPVIDDLPADHTSSNSHANSISYVLYVPLLAGPTDANQAVGQQQSSTDSSEGEECVSDALLQRRLSHVIAGDGGRSVSVTQSQWLLVLRFASSQERDTCVAAIQHLHLRSPARGSGVSVTPSQHVPFSSNDHNNNSNSVVHSLFASDDLPAATTATASSSTASSGTSHLYQSNNHSSDHSSASNKETVHRQVLGALTLALRQTLAWPRVCLSRIWQRHRHTHRTQLLRLLASVGHAVHHCVAFVQRLQLLCAAPTDVAQLLLPAMSVGNTKNINNINTTNSGYQAMEPLAYAALLVQELLRHTCDNSTNNDYYPSNSSNRKRSSSPRRPKNSNITDHENSDSEEQPQWQVQSVSVHWQWQTQTTSTSSPQNVATDNINNQQWRMCRATPDQLCLMPATHNNIGSGDADVAEVEEEEEERLDEQRLSLLQRCFSNSGNTTSNSVVCDESLISVQTPSPLSASLLRAIVGGNTSDIDSDYQYDDNDNDSDCNNNSSDDEDNNNRNIPAESKKNNRRTTKNPKYKRQKSSAQRWQRVGPCALLTPSPSNTVHSASLLIPVSLSSALQTLALISTNNNNANNSTNIASSDNSIDMMVSHCVLQIDLIPATNTNEVDNEEDNEEGGAVDWRLLRTSSNENYNTSNSNNASKTNMNYSVAVQRAFDQLQTAVQSYLFAQPLALCRDLRNVRVATQLQLAQERRLRLVQQVMALLSLEGNSARLLLQRFVRLLTHALGPLGCVATHLVVRDTGEDVLLYDETLLSHSNIMSDAFTTNFNGDTYGNMDSFSQRHNMSPLFSPAAKTIANNDQNSSNSESYYRQQRPLSVSTLMLSPSTPNNDNNNNNDNNAKYIHDHNSRNSSPNKPHRVFFSDNDNTDLNNITNSNNSVRFVVESSFDYEELSGVLKVSFSGPSPTLQAFATAEAWSLAENLTAPLSPAQHLSADHPRHNHNHNSNKNNHHHSSGGDSKVRFHQHTTHSGNNYSGNSNEKKIQQQGCEEVLETLSRALARRAFELHRGAKNKQRMRDKQVALSQANAELIAKSEQVESLEATQSLTLTELRDRSLASERVKAALLTEHKAMKDLLAQKKDMNLHLQKTLAELRKDADKKEALLTKQVKELKDRLTALDLDRTNSQKEMSKAQQKEFAATLQKTETQRQLSEVSKAFAAAEVTIRSLKSEIAALEQRERGLAESGDLRLKGFLQRVRALEEDLAAARGTNAFLKKQLEAASQQLKLVQEQSGRKLESLQTTMTRSLSLQSMTLQQQLVNNTINNSNNIGNSNSRTNSPLPTHAATLSRSSHTSPVQRLSRSNSASGSVSPTKQRLSVMNNTTNSTNSTNNHVANNMNHKTTTNNVTVRSRRENREEGEENNVNQEEGEDEGEDLVLADLMTDDTAAGFFDDIRSQQATKQRQEDAVNNSNNDSNQARRSFYQRK